MSVGLSPSGDFAAQSLGVVDPASEALSPQDADLDLSHVEPACVLGGVVGSSKAVQTGSNGFTCFIDKDGTPECDDQNVMEWRKALQAKQTPPSKIGFIFMLAGDTGTSNHDYAERHTHKHWVQTGPHVMIVGGAAREMLSPVVISTDKDRGRERCQYRREERVETHGNTSENTRN